MLVLSPSLLQRATRAVGPRGYFLHDRPVRVHSPFDQANTASGAPHPRTVRSSCHPRLLFSEPSGFDTGVFTSWTRRT